MKYLILLSTILSFNLRAEVSSDDIALADETIQSPTMNLEGQYKVKEAAPEHEAAVVVEAPVHVAKKAKSLSQSDRLKLYRERLEERNRVMVERKMEQIRFRQELALARQLEQSMNKTLNAIDSVK
jgi:predicted alpha/beta-fold hydrolase